MTRYTVYHYGRYVALDERAHIIEEFIGHVGVVLGYPLAGNEFFVICDLVNICYFCAALIRIIGRRCSTTIFLESPSSAAFTAAPPT